MFAVSGCSLDQKGIEICSNVLGRSRSVSVERFWVRPRLTLRRKVSVHGKNMSCFFSWCRSGYFTAHDYSFCFCICRSGYFTAHDWSFVLVRVSGFATAGAGRKVRDYLVFCYDFGQFRKLIVDSRSSSKLSLMRMPENRYCLERFKAMRRRVGRKSIKD